MTIVTLQSVSLRRPADDLQGVEIVESEIVTEIVNGLVNTVVENVEAAALSGAETARCREPEIKTEQDAIPEIFINDVNDGDNGDNKHSRAKARAEARAKIAPSRVIDTIELYDEDDDDGTRNRISREFSLSERSRIS